jgi:hypothetical protein
MADKKEFSGKPFTKENREQSIKDIVPGEMDEKRTVCNVIRLIFQNSQDGAYNLGAVRELALEAMWMGKRMNDKLTKYRQDQMYEEYINQDESHRNDNYDLAQGNWD